MKLLYAFPEPLPLPKARGIQVAWMVDALCAAGIEVTLAHVPTDNAHPLAPLGKPQIPGNLKVVPISRHWPFPFSRWHSVARFTYLLLRWIDQHPSNRPDIIFVRHLKLAARLLKARPDLPLIYEAHECFSTTAPAAKRAALAAQEAHVLANATGVVFISGAVQNALQRQYAVTPHQTVLHSGVDLPATVIEKDWANCHRHIIYAGSFFGWKGVDDLIDAAAGLPGYRITLIGGDAAEIARLQKRIAPAGAEVELLPRLPADQVMAYLQNACIAVLPNRAEGVSQFTSPLKLFEYMGAGCAVVASDLPSIREVLPQDGAAWCRPGNPESLAMALQQLASAPELAQSQGTALRRLAENYTWHSRALSLARFAEALLLEHGGNTHSRTS